MNSAHGEHGSNDTQTEWVSHGVVLLRDWSSQNWFNRGESSPCWSIGLCYYYDVREIARRSFPSRGEGGVWDFVKTDSFHVWWFQLTRWDWLSFMLTHKKKMMGHPLERLTHQGGFSHDQRMALVAEPDLWPASTKTQLPTHQTQTHRYSFRHIEMSINAWGHDHPWPQTHWLTPTDSLNDNYLPQMLIWYTQTEMHCTVNHWELRKYDWNTTNGWYKVSNMWGKRRGKRRKHVCLCIERVSKQLHMY